uniref:Uncharacterized protein n=1 Tax=mine drainage metagenome TaxID=410659 RepID=E6PLD4_9ZZZZ
MLLHMNTETSQSWSQPGMQWAMKASLHLPL